MVARKIIKSTVGNDNRVFFLRNLRGGTINLSQLPNEWKEYVDEKFRAQGELLTSLPEDVRQIVYSAVVSGMENVTTKIAHERGLHDKNIDRVEDIAVSLDEMKQHEEEVFDNIQKILNQGQLETNKRIEALQELNEQLQSDTRRALDRCDEIITEFRLREEKEVENARRNLRNALNEPNLSSERILECCRELENLSPDDILAKFYSTAVRSTPQELEKYLLELDVRALQAELEQMVTVLIRSLTFTKLNAVSMFISKIKDVDPAVHERVAEMYEQEAEKIDKGLYDPTIPRDAFVAYRSTDMKQVVELVGFLEREVGLTCFASYKNLQHGINARENYDALLKQAMNQCTVLVFVSSVCSRREGDARHKELLYVEEQDFACSPAEYQASRDYASIPQKYKKPRVEYLIESYTDKLTENFAKAFFDGYTQRESPEAVAKAIIQIKDDIKRSRVLDSSVSKEKDDVKRNNESKKQQETTVKPRTEDGEVTPTTLATSTNPPTKHTITFIADGKKIDTFAFVEGDISVREPSVPFKVGYSGKWCSYTLGSHDLKVQAVYTSIRYTIMYSNVEGAANFNPTSYTVKDLPLDIKPLAKDGYSFVGWYVDEAMTKGVARLTEQGDYVLYAKWIRRVEPTDEFSEEARKIVLGFTSDDVARKNLKFTLNAIAEDCLTFTLKADGTSYEVQKLHKSVEKLIIPRQYRGLPITSIGENALEGCISLQEITIPSSVASIGEEAFSECTNLQTVTFEDDSKLQSIGVAAFFSCSSLQEITIPSSVKSIGEAAFRSCTNLKTVTFEDDSKLQSIGNRAFNCCRSLTSITIPSAVTSIGGWAFWNCTGLQEITIPITVTSIGAGAFWLCSNLKEITIPSSVTSIYEWTFSGCRSLTSITIPGNITSIGESAFRNCNNLQTVTFDDDSKLQSVGKGAFSCCSSIKEITIPSNVTSIQERAFAGCSNLKEITIPSNITSIDKDAFSCCTVYFEGSETKWKKVRNARHNTSLKFANIYYYSEKRPNSWKLSVYWHWDETKTHPVIWQ